MFYLIFFCIYWFKNEFFFWIVEFDSCGICAVICWTCRYLRKCSLIRSTLTTTLCHIHLNSLFLIFVTETISRNNNSLKTFILKVNICKFVSFMSIWQPPIFFNNLFSLFVFLWFLTNFLSILMVIISLKLTRVTPDRNILSINVELTSTFFYSTEIWSIACTEF